jgi:hypothetical protein
MKKPKKEKTMIEVTAGYEQFIKKKVPNRHGKGVFLKVLKKATKSKQHGSK